MTKKIIFILSLTTILIACGSEKEKEAKSKEPEKEKDHPNPTGIQLKDLYFMEGNWIDASGSMPDSTSVG